MVTEYKYQTIGMSHNTYFEKKQNISQYKLNIAHYNKCHIIKMSQNTNITQNKYHTIQISQNTNITHYKYHSKQISPITHYKYHTVQIWNTTINGTQYKISQNTKCHTIQIPNITNFTQCKKHVSHNTTFEKQNSIVQVSPSTSIRLCHLINNNN